MTWTLTWYVWIAIGWFIAVVGFVLGAAWAGLGIKNKDFEKKMEEEHAKSSEQS